MLRRTTLLLGLTSALWAQPRAYFPWWELPLARELQLSPSQQEQIQTILRQYRNTLIDQRARVEKAEAALEDLFNRDQPPDPQTTNKVIDELVEARAAITRTFTEMSWKLRQVLTPEQWRRLQERRQRWRPGWMREWGMPPGPGRPFEPREAPSPRPAPGYRAPGGPRHAP